MDSILETKTTEGLPTATADSHAPPTRNLPSLVLNNPAARVILAGHNNGAPDTARIVQDRIQREQHIAILLRSREILPITLSPEQKIIIIAIKQLEDSFDENRSRLTRYGRPSQKMIVDCERAYEEFISVVQRAIHHHGNLFFPSRNGFTTSLELTLNKRLKDHGVPKIDHDFAEKILPGPPGYLPRFAPRDEDQDDEPRPTSPTEGKYDFLTMPHSVFKNSTATLAIFEGLIRSFLMIFIAIGDIFRSMNSSYESFSMTKGFAASIKLCFTSNP